MLEQFFELDRQQGRVRLARKVILILAAGTAGAGLLLPPLAGAALAAGVALLVVVAFLGRLDRRIGDRMNVEGDRALVESGFDLEAADRRAAVLMEERRRTGRTALQQLEDRLGTRLPRYGEHDKDGQ